MKKEEFFLAAMKAEEFRRKAWVISAFTLINEPADAWKHDPYDWRIVQTPAGHLFVKDGELQPIEGCVKGEPPFAIREKAAYLPQVLPIIDKPITATYGQWLANFTINFWPFGKKLGFLPGNLRPGKIENLIVPRLKDTPKEGEARNDAFIYVDEYLKFCDAMFFLAGFTQVCVPGATPKSLVAPPGIKELRKKLLEENKDRLHDPAVIAKIDAELVAYDKAYLKDDPSANFYMDSGKSWAVVRKKMFGMHGAEVGLSERVDVKLIENSLSEGWDISAWPEMNDSLRAGSYNRGAQTMLGGESVKWLLRASSNITVTQDDCGTKLGNQFTPTEQNYTWMTGFQVIEGSGKSTPVVSDEDAHTYIGKKLMVRSPMYCKLEKTDYCKACVGVRLAENPTGLSVAISEYGSTFLGIYMSAAHGKALQLQKMDIKTAIQ